MEEKTFNFKKFYSVCFLILMGIFCAIFIFVFTKNHFLYWVTSRNQAKNTSASVSFSELYPFEDNISSDEQNGLSYVESYRNRVEEAKSNIDNYFTKLNPLTSQFKVFYDIYSDLTYGKLVYNGYDTFVKLPNGYLAGCFDYCFSTKACNNILDFSNWLNDMNVPFLTLITPDKSDDSIIEFPKGVPHGYSQTLNEYKDFLNNNGIDYIEAKKILLSQNDNFYSWFYKSDHHWNVHAAYLMARKTAEYINDEFSVTTDKSILDDDNFELKVYPDSYLGSYGNKLGNRWKEDMEVLYPKIETNFHIEIPKFDIDKTGSFENTLIDQSKLSSDQSYYSAFLYGDYSLIHIENNNCKNESKILVIKLSFADEFCPYLANTVKYVDMIDPRLFNGSIRSYIKQTKPDVVVSCIGAVGKYEEDFLDLK